MKAFLYCRKSTESEDRQALSLDAQEREGLELAKRLGLEVAEVFRESKSAKKWQQRPVFSSMMERIWKGEAECVVSWKLDRLARNPMDGAIVMTAMQDGPLSAIHTPHRTYKKEDNVLLMQIEFGMANQYIRDLSQNVIRGMREKARNGGWTRKAPIGYRNDRGEKTVLPDPERAELVKEIFLMRAKGMTLKGIAQKVSAMGLRSKPTKRFPSKPLGIRSVEFILKNPFYIGMMRVGEELMEGSHAPLLDPGLWHKVQRERKGSRLRPNPALFPFKGILSCGACGLKLTAEVQKGKFVYYKCPSRSRCVSTVSQEKVAEMVGGAVGRFSLSEKEAALLTEVAFDLMAVDRMEGQARRDQLKKRIRKAEDSKEALIEMRKNGELEAEDYKERYQKANQDLSVLRRELEAVESGAGEGEDRVIGIIELLKNSRRIYKDANFAEKAALAKSLCSNFAVTKEKATPLAASELAKGIFEAKNHLWQGQRDMARTILSSLIFSPPL